MRIEYQHKLAQETAYERINTLLDELKAKYSDKVRNITTSWDDRHSRMTYSLEILKFNSEGEVILENNRIIMEGKLPWTLKPLSSKIENIIREKLDKIFLAE